MNLAKKGLVENFAITLVMIFLIVLFIGISFYLVSEVEDSKAETYLYDINLLSMSTFSRNVASLKVDSDRFSDKIRLFAKTNDCNGFNELSYELMSDLDDEWFTYFRYVKDGEIEVSCITENFRQVYTFREIDRVPKGSIQAFRPIIIPSDDNGLIYFAAYDSRVDNFQEGNLLLQRILDSQSASRGYMP